MANANDVEQTEMFLRPLASTASLYIFSISTLILSISIIKHINDAIKVSRKWKHLSRDVYETKVSQYWKIYIWLNKFFFIYGNRLQLFVFVVVNVALCCVAPYASVDSGFNYVTLDLGEIANRAAWVGCGNLFFVVMFATRNSILLYLTGTPFERSLMYHRWFGTAIACTFTIHFILHTVDFSLAHNITSQVFHDMQNVWGLVSYGCLMLIALTSIPVVRRKWFRTFYYSHFGFLGFFVFGVMHRYLLAWYMTGGFLLWIIDRTIRFVKSRRTVQVKQVQVYGDKETGCTSLILSNQTGFKPGQYAFISIPGASGRACLDWHPFSIASGPNLLAGLENVDPDSKQVLNLIDNNVAFYLKSAGDFTIRVWEKMVPGLKIGLDGYYGRPKLDFYNEPVAVLMGGGIGITAMLSILRDAMGRMSLFPRIASRGIGQTSSMSSFGSSDDLLDEKYKLPALYHPSLAYALRSVQLYWTVRRFSEYLVFRQVFQNLWKAASILEEFGYDVKVIVYLTKDSLPGNATVDEQLFVQCGRPDVQELFGEIKNRYPRSNVQVGVCGPQALVSNVHQSAVTMSDTFSLWQVHSEEFEF